MIILPFDSDPYPVVDREHWERTNQDEGLQKDERARCSVEPLYWLLNYVYTLEKDDDDPSGGEVARFPNHEYLIYIFQKFFEQPYLALDKSRQMLVTWLMMAGYLWYCQFRENEEIIVQTKNEKDADTELVRRARFIWEREPGWMWPAYNSKKSYSFKKLVFPKTNSVMYGLPSGADQIRSHNPTRYFLDEGGFLEGDFEECRTAALACCADIKCVSTANAGLWGDFVEDTAA